MKKFVLISSILLLSCLSDNGNALQSLIGSSFVMDVGEADDTNPANLLSTGGCYALTTSTTCSGRLSAPQTDSGHSFRTIGENCYLMVSCNLSAFDIPLNSVPFIDAVLSVTYRDDSNYGDCANNNYYCRDQVVTFVQRDGVSYYPVSTFGGAFDNAWKTEDVLLASNPYQSLRVINGIIQFGVWNYGQPTTSALLPIDKFELKFFDHQNFLTFRENLRAQRHLHRWDYLNGTLPTAPASNGQPFALFKRNYLEKIYSNTVPKPNEIAATHTLYVNEVCGQYEPATINVFAFQDITEISVSVTGIDSNIATITSFEVLQEDRLWKFTGRSQTYYGSNPWSLRPIVSPLNSTLYSNGNWQRLFSTPISLTAGRTKQLWFTIKVESNAPAGIHTGAISICAKPTFSGSSQTCKTAILSLNVIDLALPAPDADNFLYYQGKYTGGFNSNWVLKDITSHGPVTPHIHLTGTQLVNGTMDYSSLKNTLDAMKKVGMIDSTTRIRFGNGDNYWSLWSKTYGSSTPFLIRNETTEFDTKFIALLKRHYEFVKSYGIKNFDMSFSDEPGIDESKRREVSHMFKLAKAAGFKTWVTYHTNTDQPLRGFTFKFADKTTLPSYRRQLPDWIRSDSELRLLLEFNNTLKDSSKYQNDGISSTTIFNDGCLITNWTREVKILTNKSLAINTTGTIIMSLRMDQLLSSNIYPFRKMTGGTNVNYAFLVQGGLINAIHTKSSAWKSIPATWADRIDMPGDGSWHQIVWTYNYSVGGTLYLDHLRAGPSFPGFIDSSPADIYMGSFNGATDHVVILGRALTQAEQKQITEPAKEMVFTTNVSAETTANSNPTQFIQFGIYDEETTNSWMLTTKRLLINNKLVWTSPIQTHVLDIFNISVGSYLVSGQKNTITWSFTNGRTRSDFFRMYIITDFWRNLDWSSANFNSEHWNVSYTPDPLGDLGFIFPWLDDAVLAVGQSSMPRKREIEHLGMTYSYYTTYMATVTVPSYNRFLSGIYASAFDCGTVAIYAYDTYTCDPWDEQNNVFYSLSYGQSYCTAQPGWDQIMYDSIVWETSREGIEDSRIIRLLKDLINQNPNLSISQDAKQYLESVFYGPQQFAFGGHYMAGRTGYTIDSSGDTTDSILKDLCGNSTNFDFFDEFRSKLFDFIQKIQSEAQIITTSSKTANSQTDGNGISSYEKLIPFFFSVFIVFILTL